MSYGLRGLRYTYPVVMVDPISVAGAASVAKALESAASEGGKAAGGLMSRVFGPAADEIGTALGRFASYRVGNVQKIAAAADRRSLASGREGVINPRLARSVLEEGSYCDDELMAEYLGGLLAGGRTPSGRDDRAVSWSHLVTSMSALQLRAHFVFYREWAHALQGSDIELSNDTSKAEMLVELNDLLEILLEVNPELSGSAVITEIISGLSRNDLIGSGWAAGSASTLENVKAHANVPFEHVFRAFPTIAGIALFGWACGLPGIDPSEFTERSELLSVDVSIARPAAHFPKLDGLTTEAQLNEIPQ